MKNLPSALQIILALLVVSLFSGCFAPPGIVPGSQLSEILERAQDDYEITTASETEGVTVADISRSSTGAQSNFVVGQIEIRDLGGDEAAKEPYDGTVTTAGYLAPSVNYLQNETRVLVDQRFEVILRGVDDEFGETARQEWLKENELLLGALDRLNGPSVGWLVTVLIASIVFLLVLILVFKIQAFVSLLLISILVGIGSGMPLGGVIDSVVSGMGGSLGFIASIIGLGAILGKILEYSGGAQSLATSTLKMFGEKRAPWAMMLTGFIISIPVFLDVALVILIPILYALARDTKKSLLHYGLPLLAGMAVTHAFIPPTPGPIIVAENLNVSLGPVILIGFIVGLPTAIIAGPILGVALAKKHFVPVPDMMSLKISEPEMNPAKTFPSVKLILFIIGLPILLILTQTVISVLIKQGHLSGNTFFNLVMFIGHPIVALIISTLLALYLLGSRRGTTRQQLMDLSTSSLGPAGIIILVTGAGGVFKEILVDSGVGQTLADLLGQYPMSPIVLAYVFAVIVRVTQGSATVAMIAASALIAPVIAPLDLTEMSKALIVISVAAGSSILSHVNDSGFWIVNRYFGMSEKTTLQTWTVVTSTVSVVGFGLTLLLSLFIK